MVFGCNPKNKKNNTIIGFVNGLQKGNLYLQKINDREFITLDSVFVKGEKDSNYYLCQNAVKNISLEAADNALVAMKNWSGLNELKNIKNETLIVWGDKDISYNFEQVNTLRKNIKNSRLEIFRDCSHNVHLEKPKEFNKLIESFVN